MAREWNRDVEAFDSEAKRIGRRIIGKPETTHPTNGGDQQRDRGDAAIVAGIVRQAMNDSRLSHQYRIDDAVILLKIAADRSTGASAGADAWGVKIGFGGAIKSENSQSIAITLDQEAGQSDEAPTRWPGTGQLMSYFDKVATMLAEPIGDKERILSAKTIVLEIDFQSDADFNIRLIADAQVAKTSSHHLKVTLCPKG